MKSSTLTSSGSAGLNPYQWVPFTMTLAVEAGYTPFAASSANLTRFDCIADEGIGKYPNFKYRFTLAYLEVWMVPGAGVQINMSVTINGVSYDLSGAYVIKSANRTGALGSQWFEVDAPRPNGGDGPAALTQAITNITPDNGSGAQPNPTVNLIMQAQKAVLLVTSGTAILAPVVDGQGSAPYSVSLSFNTTGPTPEYAIDAPVGCKFDLADWQVSAGSVGATINVRFI